MSFGLAKRDYSIGGYVKRAYQSPRDTSVSFRGGKYRVNKQGDIIDLKHYGTRILAYDTRYGTPVYEESYGGYSVSDQSAIKKALRALPNPRGATVGSRAGGQDLRLRY